MKRLENENAASGTGNGESPPAGAEPKCGKRQRVNYRLKKRKESKNPTNCLEVSGPAYLPGGKFPPEFVDFPSRRGNRENFWEIGLASKTPGGWKWWSRRCKGITAINVINQYSQLSGKQNLWITRLLTGFRSRKNPFYRKLFSEWCRKHGKFEPKGIAARNCRESKADLSQTPETKDL